MIHFSSPYFLLFLLLIPFFLEKTFRHKISFSAFQTLKKSLPKTSFFKFQISFPLLLLFSLVLGFSGIQISHQSSKRDSISLLLIDASQSMSSSRKLSSLEKAKNKAKEWISQNSNEPLALMIFSENSYLLSPFTLNHHWLNFQIQKLQVLQDGEKNTRIGDSLLQAQKYLEMKPFLKKRIVLFTDGKENAGKTAFLSAKKSLLNSEISLEEISLFSEKTPFLSSKSRKSLSFSLPIFSIFFLFSLLLSVFLFFQEKNFFYFLISLTLFLPLKNSFSSFQEKHTLFLFDLSQSMNVEDINNKSRIEIAKEIALKILKEKESISLAVFANQPYLLSPPTRDKESLKRWISFLSPNLLSQGGSNFQSALNFIQTSFSAPEFKNTEILLFSDGEFSLPRKEKEQFSFPISTIGIGTKTGGFIPQKYSKNYLQDKDNLPIISKFRDSNLKYLAKQSKGSYRFYEEIKFSKSLFLSILPFLFLLLARSQFFLRSSSFLSLLLLLSLPFNLFSSPLSEESLKEKLSQYSLFLSQTKNSKRKANLHFNLGNTLYFLGKHFLEKGDSRTAFLCWEDSLDHFSSTLHLSPQDIEAQSNLRFIQGHMGEMKQKTKGKNILSHKNSNSKLFINSHSKNNLPAPDFLLQKSSRETSLKILIRNQKFKQTSKKERGILSTSQNLW